MRFTDDERRAVAARLRELEVCEFDGEFIDCGEVENALGLVSDDGAWYEAEGVTRLADLIEPSEPKVKCVAEVKFDGERLEQLAYDAAVELTGIDREALLALADEMEGGFLLFGSTKSARRVFDFLSDKLGEYARRIREACGEAVG